MSESEATIRAEIAVARPAWRVGPATALLQSVFCFPAMLGALLVGVIFFVVRGFNVDPDLWWHLKTGENILATHQWPFVDPYSFTIAGQPWQAFEWLGDVLLAAGMRLGGLPGLYFLMAVLGGLVEIALYVYASIRAGNSKAGFAAVAILLPLTTPSFSLRPQMLGYLFIILTLIALERFRQGESRMLWLLPPLMLVWANAHGSWIIGMGILVVHYACGLVEWRRGGIEARRWTAQQRRQLALVFLFCLVAIPITPYGAQTATYPFEVAGALPVSVANILEWQPMPFNLAGGKFFLGLLVAFLCAHLVSQLRWRLEELVLFLGGAVMACLHVRFVMLFVPFFAPLVGTLLAGWMDAYEKKKERWLLNAGIITALLVAVVRFAPAEADIQKSIARDFPVAAVAYLQQHQVPGPMYNSYGFGGYLIWSNYKVFIDGRSEAFERSGLLADYMHIANLKPGSPVLLDSYGVRSCLLDRGEALVTLLSASPSWQRVYADERSVLFVRQNAEPTTYASLIGKSAASKE